jgi:hypothetical protein
MPSNSLEKTKNQVPANDAQTIKTVGEPQASRVISNITKVNEEARPVSESAKSPSSGPVSRQGQTTKTIVVEVSIEQGRVTKAWVKNSRKGLEAFEAAALRIIRLRRYSKGSTGTDSVSLDVTVNQ